MQAERTADLHGFGRQVGDTQKMSRVALNIQLIIPSGVKAHRDRKPSKVEEVIEDGVRSVRQEVSKVTDVYESQKAQFDRYYVDAMKETQREFS